MTTDANITQDAPVVPPVRVDIEELTPELSKAMATFSAKVAHSKLEPALAELVRLRASQLNGCAYCVDLHSQDAVKGGESERRLRALAVWRETPFFTARERAALALTEAGTRLTEAPVSDEVVAAAAQHFAPAELAALIWTITAINAWNRLGAIARPWPLD